MGSYESLLLINNDTARSPYSNTTDNASHTAMKTLCVLGNYSRYIIADFQIVALKINNYYRAILGNAFISSDKKRLNQ